MAQITFADNDVLTAANLNTYCAGEGGAWTTWTPAVVQSGSVTVTNRRSTYARYGRTIHFSLDLAVTGSGTGANAITVSLPVTAAATRTIVGPAALYDSSAVTFYSGIAYADTTSVMKIYATSTSGILGSAGFTAGLAVDDVIYITGTYEAAS